MASTSPELSLKVSADYASLEALKASLKELQALIGGAKAANTEASQSAKSRILEEVADNRRATVALKAENAKRSADKTKALESDIKASINAESRLAQMLIREQVKRYGQEVNSKEITSARIQKLSRKQYQAEAAEAYKMNSLYDVLAADKKAAATASALSAELLNRKQYQAEAAEAYKMNAVYDALRIEKAEKDIAYGRMALAQQIKLRKEIALAQAIPSLGTAYVSAKYAGSAINDTRSISEMEKALLASGKAAGDASEGQRKLNGMMREGHSLARGMAGPLGAMWLTWGSLAPLLAGAAITSAIKGSIVAGSQFERVLARIQGVSGETASAVKAAGAEFMKLSENSVFAAKDVAVGAQILVQAGLSLQEAVSALPTVLQLAAVGELDMATAAEIATGTMNAFGLAIKDIPGIANVLSKAADISQTNIREMGEAMKQSSTIAKQYNISLIDMSAGLAAFAQVNIRGSAAGTAYRNMVNNLVAPSKAGAKVLKDLGVSAFDAQEKIKNTPQTFRDLSKALSGMTDAQKAYAIHTIFTERGAKGVVNYMNSLKSGTIERFTQDLYKVAEQQDYQKTKQDLLNETVGDQGVMAFNSLGTAMIQAFDSSENGLVALTKRLKEFIQSEGFKEGLKSLVTGFVALAEAVVVVIPLLVHVAEALLILKAMAMGAQFLAWSSSILIVEGSLISASAALALLAPLMLPLGIAIAAVAAVWLIFSYNANAALDEVDKRIVKSADLMNKLSKNGYQATQNDAKDTKSALLKARQELSYAKKVQAENQKDPNKGLTAGGRFRSLGELAEEDKARVIKALTEVQAAQYNFEEVNSKLAVQSTDAYNSAEALKGPAKPETTTNLKLKTEDSKAKAESAAAALNAANNRQVMEDYHSQERAAKQLADFTIAQEKLKLDAGKSSMDAFETASKKAYEAYQTTVETSAAKANAALVGSAKTGAEALDKSNLDLQKKKILNEQEYALQSLKDARVLSLQKAQLDADEFLSKKQARRDRLVSESAQRQTNTQDTFNSEFADPVATAGLTAKIAEQGIWQREIEKTKEALKALELQLSLSDGQTTEDPRVIALRNEVKLYEELGDAHAKLVEQQTIGNAKIARTWQYGVTKAVFDYDQAVSNSATNTYNLMSKAFKGAEDALVNFVKTGKLDFRSLAASMIEDLIRIQAQEALTKAFSFGLKLLTAAVGSFGGGSGLTGMNQSAGGSTSMVAADGAAFSSSGVRAFASGGAFTNSVVNTPTSFPMGLMGEAGPEAIMPLSRDSSGRLGVNVNGGSNGSGGNSVTNVINVTVQGGKDANDTGDVVSSKVMATMKSIADGQIANSMRIGGMLNRASN